MKISIFLLSLIALEVGCMEIRCTYQYSWDYEILGFAYHCWVSVLNIAGDGKNVKKVTGNHIRSPKGAIYSDLDPRLVYLECDKVEGKIKYMPQRFTKFFPYLTGFWIERCPIESLSAGELSEYRDLDYIKIRYSYLKTLPANLFSYTPKLVFVDFSFNQLTRAPHELLSSPKALHRAWFNDNPCTRGWGTGKAETKEEIPALINYLHANC